MSQADYLAQLRQLAPEVLLTLVALAVLVWDLLLRGRDSYKVGYLTLGGLFATGWVLIQQWRQLGTAPHGALQGQGASNRLAEIFGHGPYPPLARDFRSGRRCFLTGSTWPY